MFRGARTVSLLANLHSDRFLGFGFFSVGYIPPNSLGNTIEELRNAVSSLNPPLHQGLTADYLLQ